MENETKVLEELNRKITQYENEGDRNALKRIIAPKLAFMRANGIIDDRSEFLLFVNDKGKPREITEMTSTIKNKTAVVSCKIIQDGKSYHNFRLFIKTENEWKLLGWANEEELF